MNLNKGEVLEVLLTIFEYSKSIGEEVNSLHIDKQIMQLLRFPGQSKGI
jgi:hypothetical protein